MAIKYRSGSGVVVTATGSVANTGSTKLGCAGLIASGGSAQAEFYASGSAFNHVWSIRTPDGDYRGQVFDGAIISTCGFYVNLTGTGSVMLNFVS